MEIERKIIPLHISEVKAEGDGWFVAGLASTWGGQPDSWGDVVAKGAFSDSLLVRPKVPLLWQHDMGDPIGKTLSLVENDEGLLGKWSLIPTDTGQKAHQLLAAELVTGLSIGFITKEAEYRDDGVRVLKAVDLLEVSLVTIGANPSAVVTSFKSDLPFTQLLERAGEAQREATRSATALRERRAATNRPLNDQHRQAIEDFLAEAKALHEELSALVVVGPEAKAPDPETQAPDPLAALGLFERELELRRRRYHRPATRESA